MIVRLLFTLLALMALAGCAARDRQVNAERARTELIGLPRERLLACAGRPVTQTGADNTEYFVYIRREGGTGLAPEPIGAGGPALNATDVPLRCDATVKLEQGRVSAITYQGRSGGAVFNRQQICGYIFERCLR